MAKTEGFDEGDVELAAVETDAGERCGTNESTNILVLDGDRVSLLVGVCVIGLGADEGPQLSILEFIDLKRLGCQVYDGIHEAFDQLIGVVIAVVDEDGLGLLGLVWELPGDGETHGHLLSLELLSVLVDLLVGG